MAPAVGLEPTTKRLTAARSTTELRRSEGPRLPRVGAAVEGGEVDRDDAEDDHRADERIAEEAGGAGKLAVAEQADDGFVKLYPNPAGHEVFIRWQSLAEGIATVKIFDTEGKNVRQRTSDINYLSLSVSDLPAGVYTVQVIQSDKIVMNRQFIIKR